MPVAAIRDDEELTVALMAIDEMWLSVPGTPESDQLETLVARVEAFEDKHYPISKLDCM